MIKFETKLNSQTANALTKQAMKKLWWLYLFFSLIFVIMGALFLIGSEPELILGITFILLGVLFAPLCIVFTKRMQKKTNATMSVLSDCTIETFVFDYDSFVITQVKGDDYRAETYAKYNYFYQIISTKTHYFLYMSAQQCHVVSKDSLVEGRLEDLDDIFARNLGSKFKIKK